MCLEQGSHSILLWWVPGLWITKFCKWLGSAAASPKFRNERYERNLECRKRNYKKSQKYRGLFVFLKKKKNWRLKFCVLLNCWMQTEQKVGLWSFRSQHGSSETLGILHEAMSIHEQCKAVLARNKWKRTWHSLPLCLGSMWLAGMVGDAVPSQVWKPELTPLRRG